MAKITDFDGKLAHVFVPTATVIAHKEGSPNLVAMLYPKKKHGGRKVLPGGRLELGKHSSFIDCAGTEFDEELGGLGAKLTLRPDTFAIRTDPTGDLRVVKLKKLTHGRIDGTAGDIDVLGLYGCPDYVFTGSVSGELAPKDGEAKEVLWYDVTNLQLAASPELSEFGAEHDILLALYRCQLEDRDLHGSRTTWLEDLTRARCHIRSILTV